MTCCTRDKCTEAPLPGRKRCSSHTECDRQAQAKYMKRLDDLGLCRRSGCKEPLLSGRTRCQKHTEEERQWQVKRREKLSNLGLCRTCGISPRAPTIGSCIKCNDKHNLGQKQKYHYKRESRKINYCIICHKETKAGYRSCWDCSSYEEDVF